MGLVAAVEIVSHAELFAQMFKLFQAGVCHVQKRNSHLLCHLAHRADVVLVLRQYVPSFAVDLSVLEISATDRRHQDWCDTHRSCLGHILAQVCFVGRVRIGAAHVGQGVLPFFTQTLILHIHILPLAFFIIVRKLYNQVVPGTHLRLHTRP